MAKSGRQRGEQPGNINALKHDFYSKLFKPGELDDLNAVLADGLTDEIAMLRVVVRRLFALAGDQTDPERLTAMVSTLGVAATHLTGLMRIQDLKGTSTNAMLVPA